MGTNVGSVLLTGGRTFLIAEGEWGRVLGEQGPILGLGVIILRLALSFQMPGRHFVWFPGIFCPGCCSAWCYYSYLRANGHSLLLWASLFDQRLVYCGYSASVRGFRANITGRCAGGIPTQIPALMPDKLKILTVIPSFYPAVVYGGTIFSSLHTCRELIKLGHRVRVVTTNTNMHCHLEVAPNCYLEIEPGLWVKYYHDTLLGRFSWPLFRHIRQDIAWADVVHVQAIFNSPTPIALYHARQLGKPVLLSPRGVLGEWILHQGLPLKRWWLKCFIQPYANDVHWHATAEQEKEEIFNHFPNAQVHVIPNGIDTELFRNYPYTREEYLQSSPPLFWPARALSLFPWAVSMPRRGWIS